MIKKTTLLIIVYALIITNVCVSLKIDRVILSTNTNPTYIDFWPFVAKAWSKMGVRPTLALITNDDTQVDESLGDVIRFKPIRGIPTSFQAQVIRLLLPALFEDDVSITGDIDMIPLSRDYFLESIKHLPEDSFVVYNDMAYKNIKRYPMCYNAAKGKIFGEVFKVKTIEDIRNTIIRWSRKWKNSISTDEFQLYESLATWDKYKEKCIKLGHDVEKRIDRKNWQYDVDLLLNNYYIDSHMIRPYKQYKKELDIFFTYLGLLD